jgi:putative ABC transport system ATP-binding protein
MLINLDSIKKIYNTNGTMVEALKGISLNIGEGEFVSITGESGSGKSTLLSVIGGIAPPTEGKVEVDGINIYEIDSERLADFRRKYIGFVFQQFHLLPYLNAIENVMLPLSIEGIKNPEEIAQEALRMVGLIDKAKRLPNELSGGEQQRVAIARAIVNEPPIVLADEPTGNLDSRTGWEIFSLFERLNSRGICIIIVTHNQEIAKKTQRIITLRDGLLV